MVERNRGKAWRMWFFKDLIAGLARYLYERKSVDFHVYTKLANSSKFYGTEKHMFPELVRSKVEVLQSCGACPLALESKKQKKRNKFKEMV